MLFIHDDTVFVQLDRFDPAMVFQDWADMQRALINAVRVLSEADGPGEHSDTIAALTRLLLDFTMDNEQGVTIEQKYKAAVPLILEHTHAETLFKIKK